MNHTLERTRLAAAAALALAAAVLMLLFIGGQAHQRAESHRPAPHHPAPFASAAAATTGPSPTAELAPTAAPSRLSAPPVAPRPSRSSPTELEQMLSRITVLPSRPDVPGYDRDCGPGAGCSFGTSWTDDSSAPLSHNGCDTRNDVLRLSLEHLTIDPDTHGCVVLSGTLDDPYTGRHINFVRGVTTSRAVEIDHLIPLAAAWDMGAWRWPLARRTAFANDVRFELVAVDGPANQQKSDSTPASWLPPNKAFRCEYGKRYLEASLHWQLPITAADAEVLGNVARKSC